MPNLYYIHPHHEFDIDGVNYDFDISGFVIASHPKEAVNFWCVGIKDMLEIAPLELNQKLSLDGPTHFESKFTVLVRELPTDTFNAQPGFIPWDDLEPEYFTVKEI